MKAGDAPRYIFAMPDTERARALRKKPTWAE